MFDISLPELFLVIVVAVVVLGPQDIPRILYGLGRIVRRLNYVRFSLSQQFDSFMDQHGSDDVPGSVNFEGSRGPRPFPPSAHDNMIESDEAPDLPPPLAPLTKDQTDDKGETPR